MVFSDHSPAVPAYYALILRSLTVLEGLALYADPDFKVLAASYPYFAKRLLTDPNPYLRDALIELLFKDGRFRYLLAAILIFCLYLILMKVIIDIVKTQLYCAGGIDLRTYSNRAERTEISLQKMLFNPF